MSLDSIEARFSVAGLNGPYQIGVYPDSGLAKIWRQASGWGYAGNELGAAITATLAGIVEAIFRPRIGSAMYRPLLEDTMYRPRIGDTDYRPQPDDTTYRPRIR